MLLRVIIVAVNTVTHCPCPLLPAHPLLTPSSPLPAPRSPPPPREVKILSLYREGKKREVVGRVLRESITSDYHIYPSFGRTIFVELAVRVDTDWLR